MEHTFQLTKPSEHYIDSIASYRDELIRCGSEFHGDAALSHFDDLNEWIHYTRALENHNIPESDWTEFDQYLYIRAEDACVIGMINYRTSNNNQLLDYAGEIGFSIRPSERNKGYAKAMLSECIAKCYQRGIDCVRVTCNRSNEASRRAIKACGGVYAGNSIQDESVESYVIEMTPSEA